MATAVTLCPGNELCLTKIGSFLQDIGVIYSRKFEILLCNELQSPGKFQMIFGWCF